MGEVERAESEDVTLNPGARKRCRNEIKAFCSDVDPGNARMLACLKLHEKRSEFGSSCKKVLKRVKADPEMVKVANVALQSGRMNSTAVAKEVSVWLDNNKSF